MAHMLQGTGTTIVVVAGITVKDVMPFSGMPTTVRQYVPGARGGLGVDGYRAECACSVSQDVTYQCEHQTTASSGKDHYTDIISRVESASRDLKTAALRYGVRVHRHSRGIHLPHVSRDKQNHHHK
jgi:hypothetical protein